MRAPSAVLFDLDGTLIDSAPDLAGAVNDLREAHGMTRLPYSSLRPMVGAGARGMIGLAFGLNPADAGFATLRDDFLARYEARMTRLTRVFDAMMPVLDRLDSAALPWGVVTNKASRFAGPLVEGLGLARRSQVLVCGDTTPFSKPHPEPLFEAARRLDITPENCVYVGDDLRDVEAGRAAGMATVAAAWGYLGEMGAERASVEDWGADLVAWSPGDLLQMFAIA